MADVEAVRKREERRRKITQNAEARMNKLLGKSDNLESTTVKSSHSPTKEVLAASGENIVSGGNGSSSPYNLRHRPGKSTESIQPEATLLSEPGLNRSTAHSSQVHSQLNPVQEPSYSSGSRLSPDSQRAEESNQSVGAPASLQPKASYLQSREVVHIACCIITALVAKIILMFGFQVWCFQTIILPFIIMELSLVYLSRSVLKYLGQPQAPGTMWSAALMLCGIKQELIDFYSSTMAQLMASKNNLCFYLFCFLIMHVVIG